MAITGYESSYNEHVGQPEAKNMGFDKINSIFGKQANSLETVLKDKMATMDPNSTGDMIEFQVEYNKYLMVEGMRSSIIKAMKDTLQSIIQKF